MSKVERRNYDTEFLQRLTRIETQFEDNMVRVMSRLDKINGTIVDYPVTKEKMATACLKLLEIESDIDNNLKPAVNNIKVKIWSIAGFIGIISGGIGSAIGLLIATLNRGAL
jgi:5,10-methylene-tetrahydrofolate dehydrogenase/methenyl tetrahydrofolate cyclohydrolase